MSASPAEVAGGLLVTATLVKLANDDSFTPGVDWLLKVGKKVPEPDKTITMYDTGGQTPNPKWAVDYPTIQALITGAPNDYGAAWTKAREVRDALLGKDSFNAGSDRWVSITCPGDVGFIGYDDSQRPMLSVNFRIIIEPAAVGNREAL